MQPPLPRIRQLGVNVWHHRPGPRNLITDVPGVAVGHTTLIRGDSAAGRISGVVRTGVTAVVFPGRDPYENPLRAAVHVINGFGKATGLDQVRETGRLETPVCLTNTLSVWTAAETLARRTLEAHPDARSVSPVAGECNDGFLNDIRGFHVAPEHVRAALQSAAADFELGSVGAGTGMRGLGFKAGVGSASRRVRYHADEVTVGILAVVNTGHIRHLRIAGLPVGRGYPERVADTPEEGSIMLVLATDGAFTVRQLGRLASRVTHGIARAGVTSGHGSGDFVIAASTCPAPELARTAGPPPAPQGPVVREEDLSPFFEAVVEAAEEAYIDGVLTARTLDGVDGHRVANLGPERIADLLQCAGLAS